ncbi:hypothetical protein [Sinomonas sp. G460-2]|uniref:hypothetical protein n=1 Tax=Sinomonas sp. G460-2 TaxID=3393464 RepID=UPI0039EFC79B
MVRWSGTPSVKVDALAVLSRLLEAVPAGAHRRYTAALVYAGMRAGEATAVLVRDVDLEQGDHQGQPQLSPGPHGELIEQSPKSHKDRRRSARPRCGP